jgi:hypothetical protein
MKEQKEAKTTDCIIDVRVTDTDAKSIHSKDPAKVLETHEQREKKKNISGHASRNVVISPRGLHRWSSRQGSKNLHVDRSISDRAKIRT